MFSQCFGIERGLERTGIPLLNEVKEREGSSHGSECHCLAVPPTLSVTACPPGENSPRRQTLWLVFLQHQDGPTFLTDKSSVSKMSTLSVLGQ